MSYENELAESALTNDKLVSIIITSFNYEAYVSQAIASALDLDWPRIEVVVVDDGSSDGSRKIIEGFSSKIISIFQDNKGRVAASNVGFAHSTGEFIIFLDSDDLLDRRLVKRISPHFSAKTSKVQCQMIRIDEQGRPYGPPMPKYARMPTAELIRKWYYRTAAYPTPQGSGNIYARSFLDRIFPLDTGVWDSADSCCLAAAPYFGDIETVKEVLVYYRIHGKNASIGRGSGADLRQAELIRSLQRHRYASLIAQTLGEPFDDRAIFRNISFAANRLISFRFSRKSHPLPQDSLSKILLDGLLAAFHPQGHSMVSASILTAWLICVGLFPKSIAQNVISLRDVAPSRIRRIITNFRLLPR